MKNARAGVINSTRAVEINIQVVSAAFILSLASRRSRALVLSLKPC